MGRSTFKGAIVGTLCALAGVLSLASAANAADHMLPGRISVVKPGKLAKFIAKPGPFTLPVAGGPEDPQLYGAELQLIDTGSDNYRIYKLPAAGWRGLGTPTGSRGYKYRGSLTGDPNCSIVYISDKVIKGICKGGVTLTAPFFGDEAIILGIPAGTAGIGVPAGTSAVRYCAQFGGTTVRNDARGLKRKNAAPPAQCGNPPGTPTPTSTNTVAGTPTDTPTVTRTPTATPIVPTSTPTQPQPMVMHDCPLASGSHLEINAQAFPLSVDMSGTVRFGLAGLGGAGGLAPASCEIDHIDPINIPSIGFVCVQPASGCPTGTADCNGGTALGVDMRANGNVGTCASPTTGNADCAATCDAHCASTGREYLSSGCVARCSDSERVCTDDDECSNVGEGSCNGPDPVQTNQRDICQCQCVNLAAGSPGGSGELQCQLGAIINVENAAPCGDGDIKVAVGRTCIPVTTATAATQVNNANFSANNVPSAPASNTGSRLACSAIAADNVTGLQTRGVANFFGSTLGDLAVELFANCQ